MTVILEGFAGAGGATLGIHRAIPDATVIGVEWDESAARTHVAAGFPTIRADVSALPLAHMRGKIEGVWCSPPCPMFSTAGSGQGVPLVDLLAEGMARVAAGEDCRAELREEAYPSVLAAVVAENAARKKPKSQTWCEQRSRDRTFEAVLVVEPARWVEQLRPQWVACEQVPAVLPLWQALGHALEPLGYQSWAGPEARDFHGPSRYPKSLAPPLLPH